MWPDLQGAELKALQGAEFLLTTTSSVYIEVSNRELYEGAPNYASIERWMKQRGFVLEYLAMPKDGHGNALFIRDGTV